MTLKDQQMKQQTIQQFLVSNSFVKTMEQITQEYTVANNRIT